MAKNATHSHVRIPRETLEKLDRIIASRYKLDQMKRSYPSAIAELVNEATDRFKES